MTNKTFKCPKCGGDKYNESNYATLDDKLMRICCSPGCKFAWSHLNDHLYLKDGEPEIVRCPIVVSSMGNYYIAKLPNTDKCLHLMQCHHGFQGFEFEDGSVSLESPWAWRHNTQGHLTTGPINNVQFYTPVLAKFVRVKGGSQ